MPATRDWQMNVETEKDHHDYHQLRCIELQIEIRAKHSRHQPDCPLHGSFARC